jgi:UDP-N-acetylmuramoyl-L-alanyl-D-glutamate--2,6-diaminopimelate ligase
MMTLGELMDQVPGLSLAPGSAATKARALVLRGLAHDSREVKPGYLFASLPSLSRQTQGREKAFIQEALGRGATAMLAGRNPEIASRPAVLASDPRRAYARACAAWFGHPSRRLQLVGVTGTNGKTTTTFLLKSMFERSGMPTALIGTVGYYLGKKALPAPNTTPSSLEIQSLMAQALKRGCRAMAMEVSSHALDQGRVEGCDFDAAVFTNLTQDHLDYHRTMKAYALAKAKLFESLGSGSKKKTVVALNRDDPSWRLFYRHCPAGVRRLTYSLGKSTADVAAEKVRLGPQGTRFRLRLGSRSLDCSLPLPGRFNVSNALAACAAAWGLGLEEGRLVEALRRPLLPPGRLERVEAGQPFLVLVDYAHTPDALERILDTVREFATGRVITVFGCGGDRDAGKRPKMGRIAWAKSDLVVLTSDNPRSEDPEKILDQVSAGIPEKRGQVRRVLRLADRRDAIARALKLARKGDVVLLAGKGHEDTQVLASGKVPFDDRKVARELLKRAA